VGIGVLLFAIAAFKADKAILWWRKRKADKIRRVL
jgi:ABC-type thiamine transport system substrate-binding protein